MTLVLGIDPSAKKIALVAKETVLNVQRADSFILYKGKQTQSPESIHQAMVVMREYLDDIAPLIGRGPRHAFVEKPLVGRGGVVTTMKQAYVGGVIRACLVEAGFVVHDVAHSTWKSYLGVKGGRGTTSVGQKASVYRAVKIRWPKVEGLIASDGDLADAAGLCLYGESQVAATSISDNDSQPSWGEVQGGGRGNVLRSTRLRGTVRRPAGVHGREV